MDRYAQVDTVPVPKTLGMSRARRVALVVGMLMLMLTAVGEAQKAGAEVRYGQIITCFEFASGEKYTYRPVHVYRISYGANGASYPYYLNSFNTDGNGCLKVTVRVGYAYGMEAFYRPPTQTDCAYNQYAWSGYHLIEEARIYRWNLRVTRTMVCSA